MKYKYLNLIFLLFFSLTTVSKEEISAYRLKSYEDKLSKNNILILDLETSLRKAVDQNLELKIKEYDVKKAKDNVIDSASGFLPSIQLITTFSQKDGYSQFFGDELMKIRQKSVQPYMNGSFGLFRGGRVLLGTIASTKILSAQKSNLNESQQETLRQTAQVYFSMQKYASELNSELARLKEAETNLHEREVSLKVGTEVKLSVLFAQQEVEEAKARIAGLRGSLYSESSNLNRLLNLSVENLILPAEFISKDPEIVSFKEDSNLNSLVLKAINQRPSLKAQNELIKAQKMLEWQSLGAFLPVVEVNTSLGFVGPRRDELYPDEQASLIVKYDALEHLGGNSIANYLKNKHEKEQLMLELNNQIRSLENELESLLLKILANQESLKASELALEVAEESYRQAKIRLKEGLSTSTELTVAQTGLERARAAYFAALLEYKISQSNFLKSIGLITIDNLSKGIVL